MFLCAKSHHVDTEINLGKLVKNLSVRKKVEILIDINGKITSMN